MRLEILTRLVEVANSFNVGVDEGDIRELLEVVPEKLTNTKLLEMELKYTGEEEEDNFMGRRAFNCENSQLKV
jgi:hypothetical protein